MVNHGELVHPENGERGMYTGFFGYDRPILRWDREGFTAVVLAKRVIKVARRSRPYVRRKLVTFSYRGDTVRALAKAMREDGFYPPRGLGRLCRGMTR